MKEILIVFLSGIFVLYALTIYSWTRATTRCASCYRYLSWPDKYVHGLANQIRHLECAIDDVAMGAFMFDRNAPALKNYTGYARYRKAKDLTYGCIKGERVPLNGIIKV